MGLTTEQSSTVASLANIHGLDVSVVLALVQKESSGHAFWDVQGKQLPAIRPEAHYFYANLSGEERDRAVKQGLAAKHAGAIKAPNTYAQSYSVLQRMATINPEAALLSISMGFGQIMGEHHDLVGYDTATLMWADARKSFDAQASQMIKFISSDHKLVKAVNARDYPVIASIYNGPNSKQNNYAPDLKRLTEAQQPGAVVVSSVGDTDWIKRLQALGFNDVKQYQTERGLNPDGILGRKTTDMITADEIAPSERKIKKIKDIAATTGKVVIGAGGGIGGVVASVTKSQDAVNSIKPSLDVLAGLGGYGIAIASTITVCILLAGAAYGLYTWVHK